MTGTAGPVLTPDLSGTDWVRYIEDEDEATEEDKAVETIALVHTRRVVEDMEDREETEISSKY